MSSYKVENKTIIRILNGLKNNETIKRLFLIKGYDLDNEQCLNLIGEMMLNLNDLALHIRYKDKLEYNNKITFQDLIIKPIQVIKSFDCFLYQCSEKHITKNEFFLLLSEARNILYHYYIQNTKEYDNAEWS